jgi:hypothetical protein
VIVQNTPTTTTRPPRYRTERTSDLPARLDKIDRGDKIDAVIALAMALDRLANQPEPAKLLGWL